MIEVRHLTKKYGNHAAVKDLSFSVEKGTVYGFLGPNGAGKSTTMNIITGCLGATEGEVLIDGHSIMDDAMAAKKLIGYLPEQPPVYPDMTPLEYLRFVAQAKGVHAGEREKHIAEVMERTGITEMKNRLIRNLSKGYRQRVGIAQALIGNPEVIILDEPTVGLDPAQIIEIRSLIRDLGKEHTLVLSSHILSEVQAVCDHILILSKGELVASDTAENLTALFAGSESLKLEIKGNEEAVCAVLDKVEGIAEKTLEACEGTLHATIKAEAKCDLREPLFRAFAAADLPILEMYREKASLEDVFLEVTANPDALQAQEAQETSEESGEAPVSSENHEPAKEEEE